MIPIPRTPWTMAIADGLGRRLADAARSGEHVDPHLELLPGTQLPDGWLERFAAGTPIPGLSSIVTQQGGSQPQAPAYDPASSKPPIVPPRENLAERLHRQLSDVWNQNLALAAKMGHKIPG